MRTLLHSVAPVFRTGSAKNGRVNDGIKVKKLIKTCVFTRTRVSVFAVVYVCAQLRVSYTRKYLGDVYPKGVEARRRAEYSADFHLFLSSFPFFLSFLSFFFPSRQSASFFFDLRVVSFIFLTVQRNDIFSFPFSLLPLILFRNYSVPCRSRKRQDCGISN